MVGEKREVGVLIAEEKTYTDPNTGAKRNYLLYLVEFDNGAVVRFVPHQNDRALLNFVLGLQE